MYRLLFLLLLVSGLASAQYQPTGSKTRFVNGIGLGTKSDAAFGTVDSLVLYAKADSTLMFKYKGTARALAYAAQLPNDSLGVLVRLKAGTSAGIGIYANNWTQIAQLGAGGSAAASFYGFAGYNSNVGSGYTSRSFTDKGYVDSSRALDVQLAGAQTITGQKSFLGTQTFMNAKFDSAIYFNVQGCCAPIITDTNYSGIAYRYTNSSGTFERIGRRALVSRFPLYLWERNDSKWVGSLSDTGMGIGIDASDTIAYVNETLDIRGNGIGSGSARLLNSQTNSYWKNYGSSGKDQGFLIGNSYTPFSASVTPSWGWGIIPSLRGGANDDYTFARQTSGTWYTLMHVTNTNGAIKFNTDQWPTGTVGINTNRVLYGGQTTPIILMWNEATPAANNRSILEIGAKTGTGTNTFSGMVLTGGIANEWTKAGFGKIQTFNNSGTITDAIVIDSSQNIVVTGTITASNLLSGTYTPTATASTNITSITTYPLRYTRVGNVVNVTGMVEPVVTTANTQSVYYLSLPISPTANFSQIYYATVTGSIGSSTASTIPIYGVGESGGIRVEINFTATSTGSSNQVINISYTIAN